MWGVRAASVECGEGHFAEEGAGYLVERGFLDGAPGLFPLGFAQILFQVCAVVLAIGEHQFVGQSLECLSGDAQMMGFDTVVFDAQHCLMARPGACTRARRREKRVADGPAPIGPAGFV